MKYGKVNLKNNLIMAPMAGYTEVGFRSIVRQFGVGLAVTEMVSAKGLVYDSSKTRELLFTLDDETPSAVQIFGSDPQIIYKAVRHEDLKKFDIIDINMGCPVPKIVKNGEGSALLKNKGLIAELLQAAKEGAPDKTITAKVRIGFEKIDIENIAMAVEKGGADVLAVHGRLREQYYSGNADWHAIGLAKKAVSIPVVANGDVTDYASYMAIMEATGCDFVMIGRGAIGRPWLFSQILAEGAACRLNEKCDSLRLNGECDSLRLNAKCRMQNAELRKGNEMQNAECRMQNCGKENEKQNEECRENSDKNLFHNLSVVNCQLSVGGGQKSEIRGQESDIPLFLGGSEACGVEENTQHNWQKFAQQHLDILLRFYDQRTAVNNMKRHLAAYVKGLPNAKNLRDIAVRVESVEQIREFLLIK